MNRLTQIYNGISSQINITQANLNMLYRRLETVEHLILENLTSSTNETSSSLLEETNRTSMEPRPCPPTRASTPTRRPTLSQSISREIRPTQTSSLSSTVSNTQPVNVSNTTSSGVPIDQINYRVHIRTNSDTSLQDGLLNSSMFENIILALLNGTGNDTDGSSNDEGITDSEREQHITCGNYSDIQNPINLTCPITMDRFESTTKVMKLNSCGHIFSEVGLVPWITIRRCCPICRALIVPNVE